MLPSLEIGVRPIDVDDVGACVETLVGAVMEPHGVYIRIGTAALGNIAIVLLQEPITEGVFAQWVRSEKQFAVPLVSPERRLEDLCFVV